MECPGPWVPYTATITKPLAGDFQQCLWTMSLAIKLTKTLCENGCWMTSSGMFMPMKPWHSQYSATGCWAFLAIIGILSLSCLATYKAICFPKRQCYKVPELMVQANIERFCCIPNLTSFLKAFHKHTLQSQKKKALFAKKTTPLGLNIFKKCSHIVSSVAILASSLWESEWAVVTNTETNTVVCLLWIMGHLWRHWWGSCPKVSLYWKCQTCIW